MPLARIAFLALTLSLTCSCQDEMLTDRTTDIVASLARWFQTGCVVLTPPSDFTAKVVQIHKFLSQSGPMTSFAQLPQLNQTVRNRCPRNQPLFVLFGSVEAKMYLEALAQGGVFDIVQVPSYPRWLLFLEPSIESPESFLADVNIPFDCEFLVADTLPAHVSLTEMYRTGAGRQLNSMIFGTWKAEGGLEATSASLFARRDDLQGLTIRTLTFESLFVKIKRDENNNTQVGGPLGRLWRILEQRMNFTTTYAIPAVEVFGRRLSNGSYDGTLGMIVRGEADVTLGDVTINIERKEAVDFLIPLDTFSSHIYVRKPSTTRVGSNFAPFSSATWCGVLLSILLVAALLSVARSASRGHVTCAAPLAYLADSLFHVLALFCQQGSSYAPQRLSCQAMMLSAGLTSIVFVAAYSAVLTSFLTVQKSSLPFDTIRQFVEDGSYQLGLPSRTVKIYFNENTTHPFYRKMYRKLILPGIGSFPEQTDEGVARTCKEPRYAWLQTDNNLIVARKKALEELGCTILPIPDTFDKQQISFFVAKGYPIRGLLDRNLQILRDDGVLTRLLQPSQPMVAEPPPLEQVTIDHVASILVVVCVGLVASGGTLLCEIGSHLLHSSTGWGARLNVRLRKPWT